MATDIPFSLLFKGRNGSTEKSFRFTLGAHALGAVSRLCGGGEGEGEEKREDESRTGGNPIERHDDNETIFDGFGAHKPNNSIAGAEAWWAMKKLPPQISCMYRVTGRFRG